MDLEDIQSDLHALRKLYELLQNDRDGFQNTSSEILDEKARLLLKNLLDGATEWVFEAHSKIIAAKSGVFTTPCCTQLEQSKDMLRVQPPVSAADVLRKTPSVAQNSAKDLGCRKIVLQREEWRLNKPPSQVGVSEQSKLSIAATEPEKRKKRCRACQRSSVKQLNSAEERKTFNEETQRPDKDISLQHQHDCSRNFLQVGGLVKGLELNKKDIGFTSSIDGQRQKRICEIPHNLNGVGSAPTTGVVKSGAMHNFTGKIEQEPVGANSISKEVADTIKQIQSRISALQLAAEHVDPLEESAAQHGLWEMMANSIPGADSVSPMMQTKEGLITRRELSHAGQFVLGRNDSPSQLVSQKVRKPKCSSWAHQMPSQLRETKLSDKTMSQTSKPLPSINDSLSQLEIHNVGRNKGIALIDDMLSHLGKPIDRHKLPSHKVSQVPGQNVKAIVEKNKSLSRVKSQNDHMPSQTRKFVHGFRVPPGWKEIAIEAPPLPAKMLSQIGKENWDQNRTAQKEIIRKIGISQLSTSDRLVGSTDFVGPNGKIQAADAGHKMSRTQTSDMTQREKVLPHQTIVRPAMLIHKPGQIMVSPTLYEDRMGQERSGVEKIHHVGPQRKILSHQQESEDSNSSSRFSSTWTSLQASTSSSESERSSLPCRTRSQHYMAPTSSSESEVYPLLGRSRDHQVGPTSSSESDLYSLPSRTRAHSSSESDSFPTSDQTGGCHRIDLTSRRMSPGRNYRSGNWVKSKKKIGRLRKLKDKLAIIFHHHHHHHYHDDNDDSHSDHRTKAGHATSLWKHARKVFHRSSKDEAYGERAVEKLGKSVVRNVPDKNQRRHFHTLVEGLLRHVRHSKKSKPSRGGIGQSAKGQHGSKKAVKELHWWQMFRRRRRAKLPNKPRVKLGFGSKKPQLGALPKMR